MKTIATGTPRDFVTPKTPDLIGNPYVWGLFAMVVLVFVSADSAHAASTGTAPGLPWESPMERLRQSISGPVAFTVALLGIVAGGATLIWGGEVSEFTRRIVFLVLVISIIVFANNLLTGALFTGATIPSDFVPPAGDLATNGGAE